MPAYIVPLVALVYMAWISLEYKLMRRIKQVFTNWVMAIERWSCQS